jgi:hypothetical protein
MIGAGLDVTFSFCVQAILIISAAIRSLEQRGEGIVLGAAGSDRELKEWKSRMDKKLDAW